MTPLVNCFWIPYVLKREIGVLGDSPPSQAEHEQGIHSPLTDRIDLSIYINYTV